MRIVVNGVEQTVATGTTVAELVAGWRDAAPAGVAVAVNGEVVRRADWPAVRLSDDDRVEVVAAVQGGTGAAQDRRRSSWTTR